MSLMLHHSKNLFPWSDLDRFFGSPRSEVNSTTTWSPAVDIRETNEEIILTADLPDVSEESLDVRIDEDLLTLKAERQLEKEPKESNFLHRERAYGAFHRSFELPKSIDPDKINAKYDRGVLRIALPKRPDEQKTSRRIDVH